MKKLQYAYFDRIDICNAYTVLEWDYNVGGILPERKSNQRRNMSNGYQLHRMGFKHSRLLNGYNSLSDNAKAIYNNFVILHNLPK